MSIELDLLFQLAAIDSPSGDEASFCDFLEALLPTMAVGVRLRRIGDSLIAVRGTPKIAIFAHIDTTGFTLGYDCALIPLGSPAVEENDLIRQTGTRGPTYTMDLSSTKRIRLKDGKSAEPGTRWVYDRSLQRSNGIVSGPYLDNRGGVWAAISVLTERADVAVAFTVGEETSGKGALVCADYLYRELSITESLICDLTWHTKDIRCGQGPAISLRDRIAPRQRYLEKILGLAEASGVPFQREIESSGGSDGTYIQRSVIPMDWVFVGAPEKDAHSSLEQAHVSDLIAMADLLAFVVQ